MFERTFLVVTVTTCGRIHIRWKSTYSERIVRYGKILAV
jgi:hypothetical protein